jgi:hypothetical protein
MTQRGVIKVAEQNKKEVDIASDIYERIEMNKNGESGSVQDDLQDILVRGDYSDFEDYFGDLDPTEFL